MRIRSGLILILLCAAFWTAPRVGHACSCSRPRLQRLVLPADGATGFPTDGIVRVFLTAFPTPLRAAIASEYRLRDASGDLVPLDSRVVGTRLDLRPRARLSPNERYTLERVFAYDGSGARLSDTERWRRARRGGSSAGLRGAWFPVTSFETAAGPNPSRSVSPQITSTRLVFRMGGGDCGPGVGLEVALQLSSNVRATDLIELHVRGEGVVATRPARGRSPMHASDLLCNSDPVTLPARTALNVRLVVVGADGTALGSSGWARATGRPRRALSRRWHRRRRRSAAEPVSADVRQAVARWMGIAVGPASAAHGRGPNGCPHGFEVSQRHEAAPRGSPWSYGALSTLSSSGHAAWMALPSGASSGRSTAVYRIAPDATATLAGISGSPATGGGGALGPYFVVAGPSATNDAGPILLALDATGQTRWTAHVEDGRERRIASSPRRVLVSWRARTGGVRTSVSWSVFDARTGARIDAIHRSRHPVAINGGLASAFVGGRFFIAWTGSSVALARLSPDGQQIDARPLGVPNDGPFDLVSTGRSAALVTTHQGEIRWHLLDANGRVVRGPVTVSEGVGGHDNRKPRVAWNGEVFAVAWETNPGGRTYVAAVDEAGRVSPALAFEPRRHTTTVGVAAVGDDFVAAYTADPYEHGRAMVTALRCRTRAPVGSPQHIDP